METTKIKQITEEQFDKEFTLVKNVIDDNAAFDGYMFETYGDELTYVIAAAKENRVLTIIEGDGDEYNKEGESLPNMFYTTGFHLVNRIGYLILEKPYTYEFEVKID